MKLQRIYQLAACVACMVAVANLQYGWTLFVLPIDNAHHWGRAAIQVAFTIFIWSQTLLGPVQGYLVDRFGPRVVVAVGGILVALGWMSYSYADTLSLLYAGAICTGVGAGCVMITTFGNVLKWFPDRRGLAVGLTSAGFGIGSMFTVSPLTNAISGHGYQFAFFWFGLAQGTVVLLVALTLRAPTQADTLPRSETVQQGVKDIPTLHAIRTQPFWLLYVMFVLVATGGLMATAQLALVAKDLAVGNVPVTILAFTMPALTFALAIDRGMNGVSRPLFGLMSDRIGRENTMCIAFFTEGVGVLLLAVFGYDPLLFVLFSGLVFFAWGEIYSLFPALCTDLYGSKHATMTWATLYTAKGVAAGLVPLGNLLASHAGTWTSVFLVAASFDVLAGLLALFVLKPMRQRLIG